MNDSKVINTLGGTFYQSNLKNTSIIDLAFISYFKETMWGNWNYLAHTGSDHKVITFELQNTLPTITKPIRPLYNYKLAK